MCSSDLLAQHDHVDVVVQQRHDGDDSHGETLLGKVLEVLRVDPVLGDDESRMNERHREQEKEGPRGEIGNPDADQNVRRLQRQEAKTEEQDALGEKDAGDVLHTLERFEDGRIDGAEIGRAHV